MDIAFRLLVSGMAALVIYHTIHKLRLVSRIYTEHARINFFQMGPLYALSGLAARTAIGISLPTYLWLWFNASAAHMLTYSDIIPTIFFSLMILAAFIWPLLGAHRLLVQEKQRLLDRVARRMEVTLAALHGMIDANQLGDERSTLKDTLDGLVTEQTLLQKLRTWPWRSETLGSVGAAFLVPIIIWIIQCLLERLGI